LVSTEKRDWIIGDLRWGVWVVVPGGLRWGVWVVVPGGPNTNHSSQMSAKIYDDAVFHLLIDYYY